MDQLIPLLILGLLAGILSGLFGIGGGALIVPTLIIFFSFEQVAANGTSLAALLLPVGIFAVWEYYRAEKLRFAPALLVALGLSAGAWFGASIALDLPTNTLRVAYGIFLLYMSWRYIAPRQWLAQRRGLQAEPPKPLTNLSAKPKSNSTLAISLMVGLVAGVFSGLFGIGGGVVIVPAMTLILGFDQKTATGISLGALLLPVGLPGAIRYYQAGQLDIAAAAPIAFGLLIGALFGARIALGLEPQTIRRWYGVFLFIVGIRFVFNL